MCGLIFDIISYCVSNCDIDKINVYDKIVITNKNKRENIEIKETFT